MESEKQLSGYFDVLIIEAGPIGLSCGIEAVRNGFSHVIIEKGCLVNSIFHYPTNMTFFSTSDRLEIGDVPFVSHGDKPTRREALEYYRRVKATWNLNVKTYEKVVDMHKEGDRFSVNTDKGVYEAGAIIVSSGFYDKYNPLNIPGENLEKVRHYYDEPHPYAYQKIAVIGGGNSAVDVALETFRRGAEVTMIVREPDLKDGIKYWVRPDIENRIKEASIKAYFNSAVNEIRDTEIDIATPEGSVTLENDFVLAMTGYHPDYDLLKMAGIDFSSDERLLPDFDSETHETNQPNVFLAGVVCGGMETTRWLIENSRDHASKIFAVLSSRFKTGASEYAQKR